VLYFYTFSCGLSFVLTFSQRPCVLGSTALFSEFPPACNRVCHAGCSEGRVGRVSGTAMSRGWWSVLYSTVLLDYFSAVFLGVL
jgi:hypothetical protein